VSISNENGAGLRRQKRYPRALLRAGKRGQRWTSALNSNSRFANNQNATILLP
jgi:hypothetical protein